MKQKHTHGPWRANFTTSIPTIQTLDPNGINHTTLALLIRVDRPVDKANATLIAAAPDLLDVLQKILSICPEPDMFRSNIIIANALRDLNSEIRSAISKATNTTP